MKGWRFSVLGFRFAERTATVFGGELGSTPSFFCVLGGDKWGQIGGSSSCPMPHPTQDATDSAAFALEPVSPWDPRPTVEIPVEEVRGC
jgi:hypothetical protein